MTHETSPDPEEDQSLAREPEGDDAAFRSLYEAQSAYVHGLALRLSGDRSVAEDLAQDVFVAAWRALPSFRGESAFRTWLHRIAIRVIWSGISREDRSMWLELDEARDVDAGSAPRLVDEHMDLERALASLPAGARTILLLHEIDGFRYREIADQLEISIGTVKSQLHRARNLLMEYLS